MAFWGLTGGGLGVYEVEQGLGDGGESPAFAVGGADAALQGWVDADAADVGAAIEGHRGGQGDAGTARDHGEHAVEAAHFDPACRFDAAEAGFGFDQAAQADAAHGEEETGLGHEFVEANRVAGSPGVAWRDGEEHIFFEQLANFQAGVLDGQDDEGEVCIAIDDFGDGGFAPEHFDGDGGSGKARLPGGEGTGEEIVADGLGGADADEAAFAFAGVGNLGLGGGQVVEEALGHIGERVPGFGGEEATASAVEEGDAEFAFELPDLFADGGLGDVFGGCGCGDAAGADDGVEIAQLLEFHP